MSVTRLLVLGAVGIFQPAHGYMVRRELATWQVAEWAHLNPGSVYNALRTLTREGMLAEEPDPADGASNGPKTTYRLTADGVTEFERLVRVAVWELHPYEPAWLLAGLSFWTVLTRAEVLDALEARRIQLQTRITATGYAEQSIPRSGSTPEHVREHMKLHVAQLNGELAWVGGVLERVRDGAYAFQGENGSHAWMPQPPPNGSQLFNQT